MYIENHVLRELYLSDVISPDDEMMMLSGIDDSYFDLIEELIHKSESENFVISREDLEKLEKSFNEFYFEYGYIQFKRGLQIGLQLRSII
jgi:hypothetical protein